MSESNRKNYAVALAEVALDIQAIKLSPKQPFTWASGYRMPIYNDNRLLLGNYEHRRLIAEGFADLIERGNISVDVVAGTATAGISPGTTLADFLKKPFVYVRDKAKGHGMKNRIEGLLKPDQKVLMIEDLISTGGSSIAAIEAIREASGVIDYCFSIFSYGLDEASEQFAKINCQLRPLLTFDILLQSAIQRKYINEEEQTLLAAWRKDPFQWGERQGFPRIVKE